MKHTKDLNLLQILVLLVGVALSTPAIRADQWTAPTQEELSMTSQPEVPGAAAVYLYKEEKTEDKLHSWSVYVRLKVLTDKGKDYANVELDYGSVRDHGGYTISDIAGRTIHPDGTIIPFTGKPYEKLIEKTQEAKHMAKVFTLPDVEVGSIIEYRYALRYDDNVVIAPSWYIQSDLYTRKAHYLWKPTSEQVVSNDDRGQLSSSIAWFPVLPANTEIKQTRMPSGGMGYDAGQLSMELNVHDIPPAPEEEYMPPTKSFTYRVLFYYTPYHNAEDFWKSEGKYWAKRRDKFIGPGSKVTAAVRDLTSPSDTPDQKLHKLYDAVMKMENTDFTRERSAQEEKAEGMREIHNTDDILDRKRGSSDQLTQLFVAMARAAGMNAYLMTVVNRDRSIFAKGYLSFAQFDDYVAIVNIDGKDHYFDPGSRFCPYDHLAWKHTFADGIRQVDGGSAFAETPGESFKSSNIQRIADLKMDEHGVVSGAIKLSYSGSAALDWRHRALSGDDASLQREFRTFVEQMLPGSMDVQIASIQQLENYEQPLIVNLTVKGPIGSAAGKRLLISNDIFLSNAKPAFPHEKRDIPVYFHYPYFLQDVFRVTFPPTIKLESAPSEQQLQFQNFALYKLASSSTPNSVTVRRDFILGELVFMPNDYSNLRAFYNKFETKDQESIVLSAASPAAAVKPETGN